MKQYKTYLEIGVGEKAATHLMPQIGPGDKYIAVDPRPLGMIETRKLNLRAVNCSFVHADGFQLPISNKTVDHVLSRNMISDSAFPHVYNYARHPGLRFRQALEKLESELHRVTKVGASITFHEHYTPEKLEMPFGDDAKSRRQHLEEVFGARWRIDRSDYSKLAGDRGGVVIKLFKK